MKILKKISIFIVLFFIMCSNICYADELVLVNNTWQSGGHTMPKESHAIEALGSVVMHVVIAIAIVIIVGFAIALVAAAVKKIDSVEENSDEDDKED